MIRLAAMAGNTAFVFGFVFTFHLARGKSAVSSQIVTGPEL